jgi:Ca2+-binding EF-hand superfamily protein
MADRPMSPTASEEGEAVPPLYNMSRDERMAYLFQVFQEYDKDKSGSVDTGEMYRAMEAMGINMSKKSCRRHDQEYGY